MYSVCVNTRNDFEYILHSPEFSCFNIWFLTEKHLKFGLRVTLYVYFDLVINIDFKLKLHKGCFPPQLNLYYKGKSNRNIQCCYYKTLNV